MTQSSNIKTFFATALIFAIVNASNGFKRIVGGTPTYIEQVPYQVEIETLSGGTYNLQCGGSLIHPNWIISAAHCFETLQPYYVRAGVSNINRNEGVRRRVKQIRLIIPFQGIQEMGDIVLVQLEFPLPINNKIRLIRLPPPSEGDVPLGMAIASGWGLSEYDDGQLKYANLLIRDHITCKMFWGRQIKEDMFCAGYLRAIPGSCKGDSGGPLVLNGVLYGVVSWGSPLCDHNFGVFVKVPYYVQQINYIIATTPL